VRRRAVQPATSSPTLLSERFYGAEGTGKSTLTVDAIAHPCLRGYLGPSHSHCNRAGRAGTRNGRPVVNLDDYQDDPARGIYWGPPGLNGDPMRWSRPWFEWRKDPNLADPRLGR